MTKYKNKVVETFEKEHASTISAWEQRGMLEGLTDMARINTARVLENTLREQGVLEANTTGGTALTTHKLPQVIGLVRRVFPRLFANELFSVQPLSLPTGKIFYLDVKRNNNETFEGYVNSYDSTKRSWADSPGEGATIVKEMQLELNSADVSATAKKLKSTYTVELQQDLAAYHGLAAGELLDQSADEEIIREIDDTLILNARKNATKMVTYSGKPTGYTYEEWDRRFFYAIKVADSEMFKKVYRRGTWIIADPDFLNNLFKTDVAIVFESSDEDLFQVGINRIGSVQGQYRIYCSANFPTGEALLGRTGANLFDAGLVYAPYVPFYATPAFQDPETLKFKRGFMSRTANYLVSGDHYVRLRIDESVTTGIVVANNNA